MPPPQTAQAEPSHRDPFNRREHWLSPTLSPTLSASQDRRRLSALEAQKERRQHAFEAARSAPDLDPMEDLSLGSSDSEGSAFEDAAEEVAPVIAKEKRKAYRPKHKAWARDLLQHAETLDLGEGLPKGLEKEWAAMVVPKGKRCLCASGNVSYGYNTVLLSRVAGRTIARRTTVLPPDCLLDCVFDAELGLLWVLDVIKWRGTWYVDFAFEFRSFFLTSKLSELPPQPYVTPITRHSPLLLLPTPVFPAPLTPPTLSSLLGTLSTLSILTIPVLLPPSSTPSLPIRGTATIPFVPTGALLYLVGAHYTSGTTVLSAWVPNKVEKGREGREGVERFGRLVEEWRERGGEEANEKMALDEGEGIEGMLLS